MNQTTNESLLALVSSIGAPARTAGAPPCQEGIGQNVDACSTQFGNTSTSGTESERSIPVGAIDESTSPTSVTTSDGSPTSTPTR